MGGICIDIMGYFSYIFHVRKFRYYDRAYRISDKLFERSGKTMAQIYGYVRVSTREQNENRQLVAMREFGVLDSNIFLDKQSGKDFCRKAYRKLLKKMKTGDTLVVKSIDRLGRNYREILEQWRIITKKKRITIVVLDIPLLDARHDDRDLTGMFIADLSLQIFSYVAQQEWDFIRQRQAEGIAAAKAIGVRFGRPQIEKPAIFFKVRELWERKEISAREAGRRLGVDYKTFQSWAEQ